MARAHHELCSLFPAMTDEELASLREDISQHGLEDETVWEFEGETLEGRHRREIADELGISYKVKEFKGTKSEALRFVKSKNLERRNLNSSQRAAILVRSEELAEKYRDKTAKVEPVETNGDGAEPHEPSVADKARSSGTNRDHYFNCRKLGEEAPKLLDQVIAGEKSVGAAMKELKEPDAKPKATESEDVVLDAMKQPVTDKYEGIFKDVAEFKRIRKVLGQLRGDVKNLTMGKSGSYLLAQEVMSHFRTLTRSVSFGAPHCVCETCAGEKKVEEDGKNIKCPSCSGRGFINKAIYDQLHGNAPDAADDENGNGE